MPDFEKEVFTGKCEYGVNNGICNLDVCKKTIAETNEHIFQATRQMLMLDSEDDKLKNRLEEEKKQRSACFSYKAFELVASHPKMLGTSYRLHLSEKEDLSEIADELYEHNNQ